MTEGAEIRAPATVAPILTQKERNEDDNADAIEEGAYIVQPIMMDNSPHLLVQ